MRKVLLGTLVGTRRTAFAAFGAAALLLGMSSPAKAASMLSLSNGVTTVSCDTSLAFSATNCGAGFTVSGGANSNTISFVGAVGGYSVTNVSVTGDQPGGSTSSFALDSKTAITNVSGGATSLTVNFAENNYSLPLGSPLTLSASQAGTFTVDPTAADHEAFTGFGNSANTLAVAGVADVTPACTNPSPGQTVQSCSTVGVPTTFTRSGNFALAGSEVITLAQGDVASFSGTVNAIAPVPEPATMLLLGTGLLGLGARARRRWTKA